MKIMGKTEPLYLNPLYENPVLILQDVTHFELRVWNATIRQKIKNSMTKALLAQELALLSPLQLGVYV